MTKSTLLDDIKAVDTRGGHRLRADVVLDELEPADALALGEALRDPAITPGQIRKALAKRGVRLSEPATRTWRTAHEVGL